MDIKDSYLHGTIGVVKSINVNADELTYTLADKQGTQVKVTLPQATVTTNGVMSNSDKVKLDNLNIDYFSNIVSYKISLPDNSGRDAYILIAKLTSWVDGKGSDYGFIGRIVGYRGGNQLNTCCYNLVAMLSSYVYNNATIYVKQLYVDKHVGYQEALPYVVTYNGENYLALRKLGSGTEIYFEGAVKNVLPQSQWIVLNTPSGKSLPDNMTVLHSPNFTDAHSITTSKYFDGSSTKTLLHSGNHDGYTNKVKQNVTTNNASYPLLLTPSGQTATTTTETYFDSGVTLNPSTNTISANISGNATTATSATNVNVSNHTTNDIDYPLVWSNENNTNSKSGNLLFKSYKDLVYNPKNKSVSVKGSISTNDGHFNYGLAFCENTAFNVTGLFVITLPVGWSNSMNSFEIDLYEYNSTNHSKIFISGYNYLSLPAWLSTSYHVVGSYSKKVRLGYQKYTDSAGNVSNRCCIILGDLDSEWDYPSVYLTAVYSSLNGFSKWKSGYSINFVSVDETTFNSTYTNLNTLTRSNWGLGSTTYYGNLVPDKNASYNIGSSTNKFNNVYALLFNGAVKFPNNYWNTVGDDVAIGDCNVGGCLGIKSLITSANPGFYFFGESGTAIGKLEAVTNTLIKYNSVNLVTENGGTWGISISGTATKATLDGNGNVITNTYLPLTGGTLSGDIIIKRNSSDAPSITLQRGETNDTFEDWRMANSEGYFKLQNRDSTGSWSDIVSVAPTTVKTISSKWNLLPLSNNTLNLGSSSLKWANIYTTNFNTTSLTVDDTLTVGGNAVFNGNTTLGDAASNVTHVKGVLRIGSDNTRNYIAFYGTSGDNPGSFHNTYIGENLYGGTEKSELLLFKGNDTDVNSGYDRIRHIAAQHIFQIYTSAFNGAFDSVAASTSPTNILEINPSNLKTYKSIIPNSNNTIDLGSSALKWNTVYASTLVGNLNWSLITGVPNFAPASHEHTYIAWAGDTRNTATLPSDYLRKFTLVGIKSPSAIGLTSDEVGTWVSLIGWKGYVDNSGPYSWELASGGAGGRLFVRNGLGVYEGKGEEKWNSWYTIAYVSDLTWNNIANKPTAFTPTSHGHPSSQITALTSYTKATSASNIATTDSLNTALGKLEYKAHYAYDWIIGVTATDTDEYINKWSEIVGFLDSVKEGTDILTEFVTRKTELEITGKKTFINSQGTIFKWGNYGTCLIGSGGYGYLQLGQIDGEGTKIHEGKITGINAAALGFLGIVSKATVFDGKVTATALITKDGTSSQFVKGDGSLDSNKYLVNTHDTYTSAYYRTTNVNGTNYAFWSHVNTAAFTIYAPTTAGTQGYVLTSNGSGAPVWRVGPKILDNYYTGSTRPTSLNVDFSGGGVRTFKATSSTTEGKCSGDGHILHFAWDNSTSYGYQLALINANIGTYGIEFRGHDGDKWGDWCKVITELNYTKYINTTNFPGLNSTGTVTSIKVGSTSYSPSSGVVSLPAYPTSLKNPNAIKFKNTAGTAVSYDGSAVVDLTGGVYNAVQLNGNEETSYLRFRGLIARDYVDLTTYTSGAAAYKNYDNGIYGVKESGSISLLIHFGNSKGSASALEFWTLYYHNSRIKVRKTIDSNRVSGDWKDLAWYSDVPTKTSQLTNDSGFLTLHQSLANYVTLNTDLTITGKKTFLAGGTIFTNGTHGARLLGHSNTGWLQLGQTSGENRVHHGRISGISAETLTSLVVSATASSFDGTVSVIKEFKVSTKGTNQTPKIVFDEYYNGTNNWKSEITSDFFGAKVCTETGFTHGLFITLGRNLTFSNLNVLDADKAPIARISNVLGHWFKGNLETTENITANSFVKKNGTSSQFLKADGSVDSNSYVKPSDLPSLDQSGFNRILFERFDKGTITGGNPITEQDLVGKTLIDATLVDNFKEFNIGDGYLGRLTTYLYFSLATEFNTSAFSDDGSTLYLNDAVVVTLKTCVATNITLNFVKGWNKIVWVFNENSGGDSAYFTPSIKTASNLLYMNAFPVTTPEKVHQSYVSDVSRRLESTTVIASTSYTLSNEAWTDTTFNFTSLATGTYAIQVTSGTNLVASGIMSVYTNLSDTIGDEIPLHVYGTTKWRPYLRTYQNKLLISSNDASATSRTVTIKIAQIL